MDYKSVIEGQINKLKEVQKTIIEKSDVHIAPDVCRIAETIANLCYWGPQMIRENGSDESNPQPEETTVSGEIGSSSDCQDQAYFSDSDLCEGQAVSNQQVERYFGDLEASNSGPVEQY